MTVPAMAQLDTDLAKQAQNPIASLISLPLQNNTSFDVGPGDATVNTLNIQPVYPASLGNFNVINRVILPVVYQGEVVPGIGSEFGFGDLSYTPFFTSRTPGKVMWGVGPSFLFPTASDSRLGSDKWSAGAGVVALTMPGKWLVGALAQNVWSFAGDDSAQDVNFLLFQYFLSYFYEGGWYLTSAPIITADWEASSGNRWTVPIGGGFGRNYRWGKQPVDAQMQVFWNAETPDGGGDWSLRLQFKWLFPK